QDRGGGEVLGGAAAQVRPAHGHDEGGGDALAANVADGDAVAVLVHRDVVVVVAADVAGRLVLRRDFVVGEGGGGAGEEDALDFAGLGRLVLETPLLRRLDVDDGAAEGDGALLGDAAENLLVVPVERFAAAAGGGEDADGLAGIDEVRGEEADTLVEARVEG